MNKLKLTLIILLCTQLAEAQDFKLTAGVGFPDLIHIGGAYELTDTNELGIQLGTIFSYGTTLTSTLEHRYYFKKSKKHQDLNTWFFGQRATYYYEKSSRYNWHTIFLSASIGRNHYFTENFGLTWDVGGSLWLFDKQFDNSTGTEVEDDSPPDIPNILPNLRIQLFRRF